MTKMHVRRTPDPRSDDEKVDALLKHVANGAVSGLFVTGQFTLAIKTRMNQRHVIRLMPRVVERCTERYPGYTLIINNEERTYKVVNRLMSADLKTVEGYLKSGTTRIERALHSLDVNYARPAEVMVARTVAAAIDQLRAASDFLAETQDEPRPPIVERVALRRA
jgi:hypothetical protein